MYNELFNDFSVEDFVRSAEVGALGEDLIAKLEVFDKEVGPELTPEAVIAHVKWADIRGAARLFHDFLPEDKA